MNVTPTLNLHKPDINGEDTENVWGYDLNTNFDTIDAAFAGLVGDKGDIVVGADGSLTFDANIVTAAARTVIAGTTIPVMRATLGAEAAIPLGTPAQFWRGDKSWQTLDIPDVPALQPALDLKASLASPVFTGNPTAPTPISGDNDTSLATTAFVTAAMVAVGNVVPSNAVPRMDGVALPGTSSLYARGDHVHPTDTSRESNATPKMDGVAAAGTASVYARGDHVHPTDTSRVAKTGDAMSGSLQADYLASVRSGSPEQGTVYFGAGGANFLHFDGVNFASTGPWSFGNKPITGITTLTASGSASFGGAGTFNADPANALVLDLRGRASDGWSIIRFLNTDASVARGAIQCDSNGSVSMSTVAGAGITLKTDLSATLGGQLTVPGIVSTAPIAATGGSITIYGWGDINSGILFIGQNNAQYISFISGNWSIQGGATVAFGGQQVSGISELAVAIAAQVGPNVNPGLSNTLTGMYTQAAGYFTVSRDNSGVGHFNVNVDGAEITFLRSGAVVGSISATTTGVAYNTSSDASLKEDVKPYVSGDIFDRIHVYDFAWKAGGRGVGLIAQELQEVVPHAVTPGETVTYPGTDDEPETKLEVPWGIDYSKLVPDLIAEVQALRSRVAALEAA